ncbi:hypothetical protein FRB99_005369 [Tulasnella sp. 403]|nr:hypothetical protein FRB99_005369 [Tulasnella sp. 403]
MVIPFTTWDGKRVDVKAQLGQNLMEVAKATGLPSIEGVCDGKLECATCHVYLPIRKDGIAPPVKEISEAEEDMLEYAIGLEEESRLGCQIPVTTELADWLQGGGQIKLPRF